MVKYFLLFQIAIIGFTNYPIQKEIELRLTPIVNNEKVSFKYTLKNNSNNEIVINNASFGNRTFFNLLVYDEENKLVHIKSTVYKLRYTRIFENKKFYTVIKPHQEISKKYKTHGFLEVPKQKLVKLNLKPGKYKAILNYSIEKDDFEIKNPLYQKLWYGNMESDTVKFEIK